MAGTLVIDTLNASTGPLSTNNGMSGIAKAWVAFNGSTAAVYGTAFNVSSITRNSAGNYTVTFTTAMPNANYSANVVQGWNSYNNGGQSQINDSASTSSAVAVGLLNYTGASYVSPTTVSVQVFSS